MAKAKVFLAKAEVMEWLSGLCSAIEILSTPSTLSEEIPGKAELLEIVARAIRQVDQLPTLDPEELAQQFAPFMAELCNILDDRGDETIKPAQTPEEKAFDELNRAIEEDLTARQKEPRQPGTVALANRLRAQVQDLEGKVQALSRNLTQAIERADESGKRAEGLHQMNEELRHRIDSERADYDLILTASARRENISRHRAKELEEHFERWKSEGGKLITTDLWLFSGRESFFLDLDLAARRHTASRLSRWLHSYTGGDATDCIRLVDGKPGLKLIYPKSTGDDIQIHLSKEMGADVLRKELLTWLQAWQNVSRQCDDEGDLSDE